jgi:hypothetical protein
MPLRSPHSDRELDALRLVLDSRSPASKMRYHYSAGPIDLTPWKVEAQWGRPDAAAPAREFSGRFKLPLPQELRRETLTVDLVVRTHLGDLTFRRFTGRIRTLVSRRGYSEIEAASGGYCLDKVRFGEDGVTYADWAPSDIIWDAVTRATSAGVYDFLYADIEPVDGPKVRREEFLAITKVDKLSRPIGAAVEEAELFFRDSPLNSPLCHRDRGPAEATEVLYEYVVGKHIDQSDFDAAATSDDYYDVVIYRRDPDTGGIDYLIDPILIPDSSAPVGAGYEIEVTDESATSEDDAYVLATKVASRLEHGESTAGFTVKFPHPLMVDGDFVSIPEPFEGEANGRRGMRYWIAEVLVMTERHDLSCDMEVLMVRRREDETPMPTVSALPAPTVRGA